jgi:hypothetical protein
MGPLMPAAPDPDQTPRAGPTAWFRRHWHGVCLVGVLVIAYFPLFLGRIVFRRDPAHWTFPARFLTRQQVLAGQSPAWDPRQGLGFPTTADPLYGFFYPPNWLYLLPDTARVVSFDAFLHLVWGGLGVLALAGRLGAGRTASLVGGLAWALSGYVTGMWTAGLLLQAMSFIPWVGLAGLTLARRAASNAPATWAARGRAAVIAALPLAAMLLQGEVFIATMAVGFGLAVAAIEALAAYRAGRAGDDAPGAAPPPPVKARTWLGRFAVTGGLALALAIGVGAVNWVPVRAAAVETARARPLSRQDAEVWSTHPLRLLEAAAPGALGHPAFHYPGARWVGDPAQDLEVLAPGLYLGATVLALAALALGRGRLRALLLLVVAVFSFLVAMGRFAPVHAVVRLLVPPLAYMRYPEKYLGLTVTAVALLAALGVDRVLASDRRRWSRVVVFVAGFVALAAASAWFPPALRPTVQGAAIAAAVLTLALLAMVALPRRARGRWLGPGLTAVVAVDLFVFSVSSLQDFASADLPYREPPAARRIAAETQGQVAPVRVMRSPDVGSSVGRQMRFGSIEEYESQFQLTLMENLAHIHGLASVPGYDVGVPRSWQDLWAAAAKVDLGRALRLAGVQYTVMPPAAGARLADAVLDPVMDPLPGARLFRVKAPLPRVFLAGRAEPAAAAPDVARLLSDEVLSGAVALVAGEVPAGLAQAPPGPAGTCVFRAFQPARLLVSCQAERPGVVVLAEQYAAGWRATVDGRPAPLLRVNHVMRAVAVEAGAREIVMTYSPPGWRSGLIVSLLAVAVALGLALAGRARPGRS